MPQWLALDEFGFDQTLAATPGVALVMFGQPGCGACRGWLAQLPQWLAASGVSLFYVDVACAQALAYRFELFHLPAFVLYRQGLFHRRFASAFSGAAVLASLADSLAALSEEEP